MQNVFASLLLSGAEIAAIVGTNIDWDVSADRGHAPRVVLYLVSERRTYAFEGDDGLRESLVQIDCRAVTALESRALAAAIDARLSGYRGVFAEISFRGCFKQGHRTRFDLDGDTRWFQAQLDYQIWWAKA